VILLIGLLSRTGRRAPYVECFYTHIRNNPLTRDYAFWSLVAALLDGRRMRCGRRGSCQAHRHFGEQNWRGRPGPLWLERGAAMLATVFGSGHRVFSLVNALFHGYKNKDGAGR